MKLRMHQFAVISAASLRKLSVWKNQGVDMASNNAVPGIVLENMDPTVNPKDDFYNYVNGFQAKNTKLHYETRWGIWSFEKIIRQDVLQLVNTSKELGTYKEGSDQKRLLLVFESELDTISGTKQGSHHKAPFISYF